MHLSDSHRVSLRFVAYGAAQQHARVVDDLCAVALDFHTSMLHCGHHYVF